MAFGTVTVSRVDGKTEETMWDTIVFIGRFQPFHNAHAAIIDYARAHCKRLIVLIGSANQPRTTRNPFTYGERSSMITNYLMRETKTRPDIPHDTICMPLPDYHYNPTRWITAIHELVHPRLNDKVAIIGYEKDATSSYLSWFPDWGFINVKSDSMLSATPIREQFLMTSALDRLRYVVPEESAKILRRFKTTSFFRLLGEEMQFIADYKRQWSQSPYPPTFVCVDAIVVQSGHILLVKRGGYPGKGLWALPGGFLNQDETMLEGAIRELREETRLHLQERVLQRSVVASRTFDHPQRSQIGRVITQAFYIKLDDNEPKLPVVRGGDDAAKAEWVLLSDLKEDMMHDDHYAIIREMVGL